MNKYLKSHNLSQYSQSCQAKTLICSVLPIHSFVHSFSFIHWLLMLLTPVFAVILVPIIIHPWPVSTTYIHNQAVLLTSMTHSVQLLSSLYPSIHPSLWSLEDLAQVVPMNFSLLSTKNEIKRKNLTTIFFRVILGPNQCAF